MRRRGCDAGSAARVTARRAAPQVDYDTFLADEPLPTVPPEVEVSGVRATRSGDAPRPLARPNILMFGDWGWVGDRTEAQEGRFEAFLRGLPKDTRLVIIEVGAGLAVPTVRNESERMLHNFRNATLLRINPSEPEGPARCVSIPAGGKAALEALDAAIGGPAGIGSAPPPP